ncbi:plasmid mobilization relaxosome protein MobC [Pontibacter silvestris]|uniref:Plasmid mobilization relaxosome protein MobC n=1 Tax=Pontibacter silvestris TaxID=2305183 RepID=A0ABW4WW89_9BACT|nr:plasmid mobilization relaxosome protein MobC [Pontibacter silvestris]MCC9138865.1 plasmid mobilization relaxosome protein MobC [Pontibacter silvestris]
MKKEEKKDGLIKARCTQKQKEDIERLAAEAGESVSSFILKMAFRKEGESLVDLKKHTAVLEAILVEVKKSGVNINQIAKRLNSVDNAFLTPADREMLEQYFKQTIELRKLVSAELRNSFAKR